MLWFKDYWDILMTIFAFMASLHSKACWLAHGLDGWGKVARFML